MTIELDHIIVPSKDKYRSAELLAKILGVPWSSVEKGPFCPVYVSSGLTLDFDQFDEAFPIQHYCFRVNEQKFDEIFGRIKSLGIKYKSTPHGAFDMSVGEYNGGRLLYWDEPDGHVWEILTVSYARHR